MAFHFSYPVESDYDSFEEYEEACRIYEEAEADYIEDYIDRQREKRL